MLNEFILLDVLLHTLNALVNGLLHPLYQGIHVRYDIVHLVNLLLDHHVRALLSALEDYDQFLEYWIENSCSTTWILAFRYDANLR